MNTFLYPLTGILAAALALSLQPAHAAGEILIKPGEKIAFLGDSITAGGAATPAGYVRLVISGLEANGIKAEAIPAGVSGNTSKDMLARVERDVIARKPDWMTLSCGVNDVWHGPTGCTLEEYKTNISTLVEKVQGAGIKLVILTSTMIGEDQAVPNNQKLIAYNDFLKELAQSKNLPLADLNTEMQAAVKAAGPEIKGNVLTGDGVHMNPAGNEMMATGVLKGMGLDAAEVTKAHAHWLEIPSAAEVSGPARISLRQYEALQAKATAAKQPIDQYLAERFTQMLEAETK
jgi:lysophospholipase L1-like esterase